MFHSYQTEYVPVQRLDTFSFLFNEVNSYRHSCEVCYFDVVLD